MADKLTTLQRRAVLQAELLCRGRFLMIVEIIERIGAARCRADDIPVLFHRVRVKLSRKFRVFRFPDEIGKLLDPSEFAERYEQFESFKPEAVGRCADASCDECGPIG